MNSLSENNNILVSASSTNNNAFTTNKSSSETAADITNLSSNNNSIENTNNNIKEIWKNSDFSKVDKIGKTNDKELLMSSTKISWTFANLTNNLEVEANSCIEEKLENRNKSENENDVAMDVDSAVEETPEVKTNQKSEEEQSAFSPARRPMNAFLIFCKKHRPIVRKRYPNLENRAVTRILGEWWAILEMKEKEPYTTLAKDYKDAFFTAYPNFKWYKLPAPPLRTPPIRPQRMETSPPLSPALISGQTNSRDFTPGKLADESQLGNLTALLNAGNYLSSRDQNKNNNRYDSVDKDTDSVVEMTPNSASVSDSPRKPIKKRLVEVPHEQEEPVIVEEPQAAKKMAPRVLFEEKDGSFSDDADSNGLDIRKSVRKSKGNRYAQLMANGKLLKKKGTSSPLSNVSSPNHSSPNNSSASETPKLENTIHRLQERIIQSSSEVGRKRTVSEISDELSDEYAKAFPSFDLDGRIGTLPSLSFETFLSKKKETKKRKLKGKSVFKLSPPKFATGGGANNNKLISTPRREIGSKKRKNKSNITRIEVTSSVFNENNDLSGLTTLAEIAASIEHQKIN